MKILASLLGFRKPEQAIIPKDPEFEIDSRVQKNAAKAIKLLEALCPKKTFPRIEIDNILLCIEHKSFSLPSSELARRIAKIDLKELKAQTQKHSTNFPSADLADRLFHSIEKLTRIPAICTKKHAPTHKQLLNDFYQSISEVAAEIAGHAVRTFMQSDSEEARQLGGKIANLVPADQMPIAAVEKLLTFFKAPLIAVNGMGYYSPVHYSGELMSVTLNADNFHCGILSRHPALSTHGSKVSYLLGEHRRDSYEPAAMHSMIFGQSDPSKLADSSMRPQADYGSLVSILAFRPSLISEHNLTELLLDNLPFSRSQNQELINYATTRQIPSDPLISSVANGMIPLDCNLLCKLLEIQAEDPKLDKIHLLLVALNTERKSKEYDERNPPRFVV